MAAPFSLTDAADLIDLSIQDIFQKGSESESRLFEQYYNVDTVEDYLVKDSSISGLGYAGRVVENAAVTQVAPVQGYDKTYTQVRFGALQSFSAYMWQYGVKKRDITNIATEVRNACADLRELRCADRLDQSFNTSYTATDVAGNYTVSTAGGDGVALVSASHTREDGGANWSNRITDGSTVNMAFEYNALKAAHRTAALVPNPLGKPTNLNLDTLVCTRGGAVDNRATEILGALNRGRIPGSNDNDSSSARPDGSIPTYKILRLPWITTNTSYWWMFDSSKKGAKYGLQYKETLPITLQGPNVVFKTDEIQYKAVMAFDIGHNDPRGWVGSKNTNAA